nr:putative reverse transcriptase domain-containing protein [Tanacetum cinerariifolium]
GKLNPRYIRPFKILARVGTVAHRLEPLEHLSRVHSTFHVSKLKKCTADEPLAIPLDEIQFDDKLKFIEEPVDIIDRKVKRLKQSCILIVKVRWNSRRGPEFTWEGEDQMQKKYPHLFPNSAPTCKQESRKRTSTSDGVIVTHPVDHSSSDSSSRHSSSDHSSPDLSSTSAGLSRKRRRDIGYLADVDDDPRETRVERVAHLAMPEDIPEPAQEGEAEGRRIVGVESAVTALTERVVELERDNQRLRGTTSVESQRVDRLQRGMSRMP